MVAVNAVGLFFLLTSPCIVLSLCTVISEHFKTTYADVPQLAVMFIMTAGLVLMIAFLCKRKKPVKLIMKDPQARRHYIHTFFSVMGVTILYGQGIILDINHFIAGFGCLSNWILCDNAYVVRYHIVDLLFHAMRPVFMGLECVVCLIMACFSVDQQTWITYDVAIIQSANIAIYFQTIVSETFAHHHDVSLEINFLSTSCWNHQQNNSWSHCPITTNVTTEVKDTADCCWREDHDLLRWLEASNPPLYLMITEFSLLIGEIMLEKLHMLGHTGADDHQRGTKHKQRVHNDIHVEEGGAADDVAGADVGHGRPSADEQNVQHDINQNNGDRPADILNADGNESESLVRDQCCTVITACVQQLLEYLGLKRLSRSKITSWLFVIAIPVVNDIIFVLVIYFYFMKWDSPALLGETDGEEERHIRYLWWSSAFLLLMICATVGGWILLRRFPRSSHHIHSSGLDYLPLFCSAAVLLLSTKQVIDSSLHHSNPISIIKPLLNIVQVFLQLKFLYRVKDVKLDIKDRVRLRLVWTVVYVLCIFNLFFWMTNSMSLPEKHSHDSVGWQTFDNVMGPLEAFFRFTSALIFSTTHGYLRSLIYVADSLPLETRHVRD